jgi:hypothetical protein
MPSFYLHPKFPVNSQQAIAMPRAGTAYKLMFEEMKRNKSEVVLLAGKY